jgi:DNA-binding beta-propeller fold protein YncE
VVRRIPDVDRRGFVLKAAGVPLAFALGSRIDLARAAPTRPHALVTADLESHVVVLDLASGEIVRRIRTAPGPRSIESSRSRVAIVAHTRHGVVSLIRGAPAVVWKELEGFAEPRYTAMHPAGSIAYVTDSSNGEVVTVDLVRGRVVWRTEVPGPARHVSISPDGRSLWTSLGSTAPRIARLDTREARKPRLVTTVSPPFLAHDVVFAPDGAGVWVTSGSEHRLALYRPRARTAHRVIAADAPPQHVAFAGREVFVASGDDGTVRRHALDGSLLGRASVPLDSYNVTFGFGSVVTPSLGRGTVSILDTGGRVRVVRRVAEAAHDACIVHLA